MKIAVRKIYFVGAVVVLHTNGQSKKNIFVFIVGVVTLVSLFGAVWHN